MPEAILLPEIAGSLGGEAAAGAGASGGGGISSMLGKIGGGSGGSGSSNKGGVLGLATGLIQSIQAAKLKNKANSAMPPLVDPRQAAFLSELNQKRKAIDTGADFGVGMNAVNSMAASTDNAITKSSGGDVGGTIQGLLQAERTANDGTNSVIANGQNQQLAYNSMFNELNNKIAARQLQLQMYKSQQAQAEWAQKKQSANQNVMAGAASILGGSPPVTGGAGMPNAQYSPNQQTKPNWSFLNNSTPQ